MAVRRHELDWLRAMAIVMLVIYHSGRIFDQGDFYVKNTTLSAGMQFFVNFVGIWAMPLFFFIAGAAAWFALQKRPWTEFLSERTKRLVLPFFLGVLLIVPLQVFCVYVQKAGNPHSYLSFYKYLFTVHPYTQITAGQIDNALITGFTWETGHLWFILYLFVFSLIALPLFMSLKEGRLRSARLALAGCCSAKGWTVFLFAVPFAVVFPIALQIREDLSRLFLIVPFVLGFVVYSDERVGLAVERSRWAALFAAVGLAGVLAFMPALDSAGTAVRPLLGGLIGLDCWFWILAFIGAARRKLNFNNSLLEYASEGSYPFYVLHQTVIVVLALGIVELEMTLALKYFLLVIASFICTLGVYELLVRRWNASRFLLGMKPLDRPTTAEPPQPA